MIEASALLLVLGVPLAAGACLALAGHRRRAPEFNIACSFLTLCAALLLAAQTARHGPALALDGLFFITAWAGRHPDVEHRLANLTLGVLCSVLVIAFDIALQVTAF